MLLNKRLQNRTFKVDMKFYPNTFSISALPVAKIELGAYLFFKSEFGEL